MDLRFYHLESLHWLWVVLLVTGLLVYRGVRRARALRMLADDALLAKLVPGRSRLRSLFRATLRPVALVFLVVALLDPRWGMAAQELRQSGVDILVLIDVSRSMLAEDVSPNRLGRAKQQVRDLLDAATGDRIGLVAFAGTPSLVCPLTVDDGAVRLVLDTVGPDTAGRGGSLLGDGIRFAQSAFLDDTPDHKAIILFSDGEDLGSFPREAVLANDENRRIPIYAVGIGNSETGARIPVMRDGAKTPLVYEGREVWTKLDESMLQDIAIASGGAYIPAGTGAVDMGEVYREVIGPMTRREFEATTRRRHVPRYQLFAGVAFVLLVVESLVSERRRSIVDGWMREGRS